MSIGDNSIFQTESIGAPSVAGGGGGKGAAARAGGGGSDAGEEEEEEEAAADANDRFANLPRKFRVRLAPNATLPFDFIFRPSGTEALEFSLPLTMPGLVAGPAGGPGEAAMAAVLAGLRRPVAARGVTPRLRLAPDSQTIDFELRVVRPDPTRRVPYSKTVVLRNCDAAGSTPLRWAADTSNLNPAPYFGRATPVAAVSPAVPVFTFAPTRGVLAPGESVELLIRFAPVSHREFVNTVPVYILPRTAAAASPESPDGSGGDGALTSPSPAAEWEGMQPYLELELKGTGIPPQLSFDRRELVLPPVPLGTPATGSFTLFCAGFDYLKLVCSVATNALLAAGAAERPPPPAGQAAGKGAPPPPGPVQIPLTVSFPQGDVVSLARPSIPVSVTLLSDRPCAFTTTLDFSDGATGSKVFSLPVSGCW